jgi:hypothetical protein
MKINDQGRIKERWNILPASPIDPIRFDTSIVKPEGVKRGRYGEQQART